LEKLDFVDMVVRILEDLDYPAENLCLEITERCRLLDVELLKNVAASLKSRGIQIAMDDFGTGFSTVGILKEIEFDVIKIDRSYVQMIEKSETDRRLIRCIKDLASVFEAKVCAEGIETAGMRDILLGFGVESFQGYYYAKPQLPDQILEFAK
jgi:EAL domain-containing protein (putative c-di-GMP-specific phosphodiesterase class I)